MSLIITDVRCTCGKKLCERIEMHGKGKVEFTCERCKRHVVFEERLPTAGKAN